MVELDDEFGDPILVGLKLSQHVIHLTTIINNQEHSIHHYASDPTKYCHSFFERRRGKEVYRRMEKGYNRKIYFLNESKRR